MSKKDYICIIDTETANNGTVVDFAAVVLDRKGNIATQCAVLTKGIYDARTSETELFSDPHSDIKSIWNRQRLNDRYAQYDAMLEAGTRMLASVHAINRWLEKVAATYNPYLTAYNLAFDVDKCAKTAIDVSIFPKRFCLWAAAAEKWAYSKKYRAFVLQVHAFNNVTKLGNMTYKANAETLARFVLNDPDLPDEPHTALEDIIFYEIPILLKLVKRGKLSKLSELSTPSWQNMQVKDHFVAR